MINDIIGFNWEHVMQTTGEMVEAALFDINLSSVPITLV